MKNLGKVEKSDYKFVPLDPDPGFDPVHNQRVIDETIKKADELWKKKKKDFNEGLRERSQAVATYLESVKQGGRDSDITRYFGKTELYYLKGQKMIEELKQQRALNPNGSLFKRVENIYATQKQKRRA